MNALNVNLYEAIPRALNDTSDPSTITVITGYRVFTIDIPSKYLNHPIQGSQTRDPPDALVRPANTSKTDMVLNYYRI